MPPVNCYVYIVSLSNSTGRAHGMFNKVSVAHVQDGLRSAGFLDYHDAPFVHMDYICVRFGYTFRPVVPITVQHASQHDAHCSTSLYDLRCHTWH